MNSAAYEMESTADLVRAALRSHPQLDRLREAGARVLIGYDATKLWIHTEEATLAIVEREGWWKPRQGTRAELAQGLAQALLVAVASGETRTVRET